MRLLWARGMSRKYAESEVPEGFLVGKKIAILGYGKQGRAQAHLLKKAGADIKIGARKGFSAEAARADRFTVLPFSEAAQWADIIHFLLPDPAHKSVFKDHINPHLKTGKTLCFSHGLSVGWGDISVPKDIGCILITPKATGAKLLQQHESGGGCITLVGVYSAPIGTELQLALAMAQALGGFREGVYETTFRAEASANLFAEQAVLCGGMTELVKAGFKTLIDAGYPPAVAYAECVRDLKLTVDLLASGGLSCLWESISTTAAYGGMTAGKRIIDSSVQGRMKDLLNDIEQGGFAQKWLTDGVQNEFEQLLKVEKSHPIEVTHAEINSPQKP